MVKYLTDEWAKLLTDALNDNEQVRQGIAGKDLLSQMTVTGGPDGDVVYHVRIEDGAIEIALGAPDFDPDVEGTLSYDTAVKMDTGQLASQTAIMTGKMKAQGNLAKIMPLGPVFELIPQVNQQVGVEF